MFILFCDYREELILLLLYLFELFCYVFYSFYIFLIEYIFFYMLNFKEHMFLILFNYFKIFWLVDLLCIIFNFCFVMIVFLLVLFCGKKRRNYWGYLSKELGYVNVMYCFVWLYWGRGEGRKVWELGRWCERVIYRVEKVVVKWYWDC